MKLKSFSALFWVGPAVLAFTLAASTPLAAQQQNVSGSAVVAKTTGSPAKSGSNNTEAPTTSAGAPPNADYWFDKGALCATYGNDRAAIQYFKKALVLDPGRSGAYFEQGISHGQLGEYEQAFKLIDKAIELEPENGLYRYGRGRVHLLAGNEDLALADFQKAADLDDEDAQTYMDHLARLEDTSGTE